MTTEPFDIVITERGAASAKASIDGIASSADKTEKSVDNVNKKLTLMDSGAARLKQSFSGLPGILTTAGTAIGAAFSVGKVIEYVDSLTNIQNQLRRTTKTSSELAAAQQEVFNISQATRTGFEGNVGTYTRLQGALEGMGKSAKLAGPLLTTISQSMAVSGTSAEAAKNGMIQFQQALNGGVLRGEEFNSIVENTPGLLAAIAVGMGKPVGALRQMAEQGQLTSRVLVEALTKAAPLVAESFNKVVPTVSSALTVLNNAFIQTLGTEKQGMVRLLAEGILYLAKNMDTVVPIVTALGTAIGVILGLQFLVWIGGVTLALGTMAVAAIAAAAPFIAMGLAFGALAAGALYLLSTIVDLEAAYNRIKATVTGYVEQGKKVIEGDQKASTGAKSLDDALRSLAKMYGGTTAAAGASGAAARQAGADYSFAAEAGSKLAQMVGEVDARNKAAASAAQQATEAYNRNSAAMLAAADAASRLSIGVQATTNAYQAMASAADAAAHAAGQAAMANQEAAAMEAATSRNRAAGEGKNGFGGVSDIASYTKFGSNAPRAITDGKGNIIRYENYGAGWAYQSPAAKQQAQEYVDYLNSQLPSRGSSGTVGSFSGSAGVGGALSGSFGQAVNDNTAALNAATKATQDLSGRLTPQGYDPTQMGRVQVPGLGLAGGSTVGPGDMTGGSSAPVMTPYGPLRTDNPAYRGTAGNVGSTTVRQTVIINTPDADSFRRSRRQVATDARRALARG